ncbi:MAG: hypothetical protein AUH89_06125 [Ktedonobacter sp. 13_1_40CM_4_52_4]|nr:MAG: hypothetical protein AUH89_06125 [Ktedonobacter sp. 13_1_40CM_4_52_4]
MIGDAISDKSNKRHENDDFIPIVLLRRLYSQNLTWTATLFLPLRKYDPMSKTSKAVVFRA